MKKRCFQKLTLLSSLLLNLNLYAVDTCQPVSYSNILNCTSDCVEPTPNQNLNINAGQNYCVKLNNSITVNNINMNGGSLKICGNLVAQTINANDETDKEIKVGLSATVIINQNLNLSHTNVLNLGYIEVLGNRIQLNGVGNQFINATTGTLKMSTAGIGAEFIINRENQNSPNEYYNYGKTILQKLRVNGNPANKSNICLNNSSSAYKFCVQEGMLLNRKTPFEVISGTTNNLSTNIIDTAGAHDFQDFYNNGNVIDKLFRSPHNYSANWVYYNGSSTLPAEAMPGTPGYTPSLYENITAITNPITLNCEEKSLPISLSQFTGHLNTNNEAEISWETLSEINSDKFVLEKATQNNKLQFNTVTEIKARGNSTNIEKYNFTDKNVFSESSIAYYRLKLVDFDGSFQYSKIISFKNFAQNTDLHIYPTIFNSEINSITVEIGHNSNYNEKANISLRSMIGTILFSNDIELNSGINTINFNKNIGPGIYVLSIRNTETNVIKSQKIIVQ